MDKDEAKKLLEIYGRSWITRDPDLIVTIFTDDATYHDSREPKNIGREAIRAYWISKVVEGQDDITFDLKNFWIDGDTMIAEWYAAFRDTKRNLRVALKEVAIFTIRNGKIGSFREYYTSTKT